MGEKKVAVHLFGALRTYKQTYKSFLDSIISANKQDGWQIDVFMHTWDQFDVGSAHSHVKYPGLTGVKIGIYDIENIIGIYQPKKYLIESPLKDGKHGMYVALEKVNRLKLDYEEEHDIKYDYHLYTRPDIMFFKPLKIDEFIKVYNPVRNFQNGWEGVFRDFPLHPKTNFCSSNAFRFGLLDSRMPNEGDLVWFSNFGSVKHPHTAFLEDKNIYNIFIKYRWEYEFRVWRSGMQYIDQHMFVDIRKSDLDKLNHQILSLKQEQLDFKSQLTQTKNQLDSTTKSLKTSQDIINSRNFKKQTLEIKNLESDLKIKELKAKQIEKELGYSYNVLEELDLKKQELIRVKQQLDSKTKELESKNTGLESNLNYPIFKGNLSYLNTMTSAKDRIHNHLSYKLGKAMIENSKSILGYIRMPYVLSYIKEQHNKEQKQYQEQIKKNPNLKLPKLESYKDYKEALQEKECFTYKLGEALMKADKTWYKGGYVKLWFEAKRLEREYREKRGG